MVKWSITCGFEVSEREGGGNCTVFEEITAEIFSPRNDSHDELMRKIPSCRV